MRFLFLLCDVETEQLKPGDEGFPERMAAYTVFTEAVQSSGAFIIAGKLQPTSTGRTVRVRGGKISVVDGPFAETKEQFGGFYLLECADMEEALALAAKVPTAAHGGCVEVRPMY